MRTTEPACTHPLHRFDRTVSEAECPRRFTYPFCYTPHPLCVEAAAAVSRYVAAQHTWQKELALGKMFGILIVKERTGAIGFLAAYSGILDGRNDHPYFVPPVYDLLRPDGYFKQEEAGISALNRRIDDLEASPDYLRARQLHATAIRQMEEALEKAKENLHLRKKERDALRRTGSLSAEEETQLVAQSQFLKADYKRTERRWKAYVEEAGAQANACQQEIEAAKQKRKQRSEALQQWLFRQFRMRNARGEVRDLCELFATATPSTPPAGAGECAAPKLLQYAYLHDYHPMAMAEFWWGASPKQEIRRHGLFYPACQGKCGPILPFMLQGLEVERNPLLLRMHHATTQKVEVIYEDQWMVVVNKPAGMLSVPGKTNVPSLYDWAQHHCPQTDGPWMVHRLDMDTSGLLVIAKDKAVYEKLQALFAQRHVRKRYVALLEGSPATTEGVIDLPLAPNLLDRPRQVVDHVQGKPSQTRYQVVSYESQRTRILFWPQTGRTHQLRVHAAHPAGLHCPIVGDSLYGRVADRLYLHAEQLEFVHPLTGQALCLCCTAPF